MKSLESYFRGIGLLGTSMKSGPEHLSEICTERSDNFQIDESLRTRNQGRLLSKYNILRELTLNPSKIKKSFR